MKRLAIYALSVAFLGFVIWGVSSLVVNQAVNESATTSYYNQVDGCKRGNISIRKPLRNFVQAFVRGERNEPDDPAEVAAGRRARAALIQTRCLQVIERVGGADPYIAPEQR